MYRPLEMSLSLRQNWQGLRIRRRCKLPSFQYKRCSMGRLARPILNHQVAWYGLLDWHSLEKKESIRLARVKARPDHSKYPALDYCVHEKVRRDHLSCSVYAGISAVRCICGQSRFEFTVKNVRCARRNHCTYKNSTIQTRKREGHSLGTAEASEDWWLHCSRKGTFLKTKLC